MSDQWPPPGAPAAWPPPQSGGPAPYGGVPAGAYPPPWGYAAAPQSATGAQQPNAGPIWVLAGWGARAGSVCIDFLIRLLGVLALAAGIVGGVLLFERDGGGALPLGIAAIVAGVVACVAFLFLYQPYWLGRTNGQTIGDQVAGVRVVRTDGRPITFGYALLRSLVVKTLLIGWVGWAVTAGIGTLLNYLWPLWDDENRALHDLIVSTRVVDA